jgi:site-specific DNA-methyltransferase (adenine-specific)
MIKIYNKNSYSLQDLDDSSIDALITDPPYGISYQNHYWDKDLP